MSGGKAKRRWVAGLLAATGWAGLAEAAMAQPAATLQAGRPATMSIDMDANFTAAVDYGATPITLFDQPPPPLGSDAARQLAGQLASATDAIDMAGRMGNARLACDQLDRLAAAYGLRQLALLRALTQSAAGDSAEVGPQIRRLGDRVRLVRLDRCRQALGAAHATVRAHEAELATFRATLRDWWSAEPANATSDHVAPAVRALGEDWQAGVDGFAAILEDETRINTYPGYGGGPPNETVSVRNRSLEQYQLDLLAQLEVLLEAAWPDPASRVSEATIRDLSNLTESGLRQAERARAPDFTVVPHRAVQTLAWLHQQAGRTEQARTLLERARALTARSTVAEPRRNAARAFYRQAFLYRYDMLLARLARAEGRPEDALTLALSANLEPLLAWQESAPTIPSILQFPTDQIIGLAVQLHRRGRTADAVALIARGERLAQKFDQADNFRERLGDFQALVADERGATLAVIRAVEGVPTNSLLHADLGQTVQSPFLKLEAVNALAAQGYAAFAFETAKQTATDILRQATVQAPSYETELFATIERLFERAAQAGDDVTTLRQEWRSGAIAPWVQNRAALAAQFAIHHMAIADLAGARQASDEALRLMDAAGADARSRNYALYIRAAIEWNIGDIASGDTYFARIAADTPAGDACGAVTMRSAAVGMPIAQFLTQHGLACGDEQTARRAYADAAWTVAASRIGSGERGWFGAGADANVASALGPLRIAIAHERQQRLDSAARGFRDNGVSRRSFPETLTALADAARAAGRASDPEVRNEAFVALQDAITGRAAEAVAINAGQARADQVQLGALVREYQALGQVHGGPPRITAVAPTAPGTAPTPPTDEELAYQRDSRRYREITEEIRRRFPEYFTLIHPQGLSISQTQAMLAADEAVLLVVPSARGTHSMVVTSTEVSWTTSAWTSSEIDFATLRLLWDLQADVRPPPEFVEQWTREGGGGFAFSRATAHALYSEIVAPVRPALAGKRTLFVVAGGALSSLPFSVLVSAAPQGRDSNPEALRATRWFAEDFALTHLPSVQTLQLLRSRPAATDTAPRDSYAGIGNPALEGGQRVREGGLRGGVRLRSATADWEPEPSLPPSDAIRQLPRLPGTETELRAIRAELEAPEATLHMDVAATEAQVRALDLGTANVVVFATHGVTAGQVPGIGEAALILTPPPRGAASSPENDGLLTASEVAGLRLNAEWVVLSACNSASQASEDGSGIGGLSRAFFYAGARNLLVSHWPVRDDVAPAITVKLLELQRSDRTLSRAAALQQAMRAVRDDRSLDATAASFAHPNAWAPFTLIGDGAR